MERIKKDRGRKRRQTGRKEGGRDGGTKGRKVIVRGAWVD